MISPIALLSLFTTLASAIADSGPLPTEVINRLNANLGTAHGGALDLPLPTAPAKLADVPGPDFFTMTMIVGHTAAITSIHVEGRGSPEPVGGRIQPGTMGNLTVSTFVVPRDYRGSVAFNNAGYRADTGDESLLELSFMYQNGIYTPDIDVSYVDGFSVPISCACIGEDNQNHVSGCSKDLWSLHTCPDNNGQGSCRNPRRHDENNRTPTEFFAPCHRYGGAYTYPDDNDANSLNGGRCRGWQGATCCIGTFCSNWDGNPRK